MDRLTERAKLEFLSEPEYRRARRNAALGAVLVFLAGVVAGLGMIVPDIVRENQAREG